MADVSGPKEPVGSGSRISHFEMVRRLGAGGMGLVLEAKDVRLGRRVAVKLLSKELFHDETARQRFLREARLAASVSHPNIVAVHEIDQENGTPFIAMELVEGKNLKEILEDGPLTLDRLLSIGSQVCDALEAAHRKGVIHRDIKSANIMLTPDGKVKVLDFGLAKALSESEHASQQEHPSPVDATPARAVVEKPTSRATAGGTPAGAALGTPSYMSPEQAAGSVTDPRSDIFSLGVVLYESATGKLPFQGSSEREIIHQVRSADPPPLDRRFPTGFTRILSRCLQKEPQKRFATAAELKAKLDGLARRVRRPWMWALRWSALAAGILAVVLVGWFRIADDPSLADEVDPVRPRVQRIAVVPLGIDSEDEDEKLSFLAGGLGMELTTSLGKLGELRVVPWSYMRQFRDSPTTLDEIAARSGADAILEGTVQKIPNAPGSGDGDEESVRVHLQLYDGRTGLLMWNDTFQSELGRALTIPRSVAKRVASSLHLALERREEAWLSQARQVEPDAMELYLRGRSSGDDIESAVEFFQLAVEADPAFAEAYAELAIAHVLRSTYGGVPIDTERSFQNAIDAVDQALALDPGLGEALAARGFARFLLRWDWSGAEADFDQALRLAPGSAMVRDWYANYLTAMGRHEEAIEESLVAESRAPLSLPYGRRVGWSYFMARRYQAAIDKLLPIVVDNPDFTPARTLLGRAYLYAGDLERGIRELEASGDDYLDLLAHAYAVAGRVDAARAALTRIESGSENLPRRPYLIALAYGALGDTDAAMDWLQRAYDLHDPSLVNLRNDPRLEPIRDDPRLQSLIDRLNFPPLPRR